MLTLLAALVLAAPLPQDPAPEPAPAAQEEQPKRRKGAFIGSPTEKFQGRKFLIKDLSEAGGQTLIDRYRKGNGWCVSHVVEEKGVAAEDGRDTSTTALVTLVMLGESSAVTGGTFRFPLRWAYHSLRLRQDEATGAFLDTSSEQYALDQALATQAMCEIVFSDGKKKQVASAKLGLAALMAARGDDGLWRLGGGSEGAPDPLTTSLAAHTLFSAREAKLEVPDEAFASLLTWSLEAPAGEGGIDTLSLLATRLHAAQATETPLKDDARVAELARLVAARIPAMEQGAELPEIVTDPVQAYLATQSLMQVDGASFQRLASWIHGPLLVEHQTFEGDGAGSFTAVENGPFPVGAVSTSSLRMLSIQNQRREEPFTVLL